MKKGFTLLELLIVIGILAILITAATLVLNPAELLKQARDSQRLSDLAAMKSAISLYIVDATNPSAGMGVFANCYTHFVSGALDPGCSNRHPGKTTTTSTARTVDGNGWLPVNLSSISSGAPLSVLPIDPTNANARFYSYSATSSLTFELNADLESGKYDDKELNINDGGSDDNIYEIGTEPGLDI